MGDSAPGSLGSPAGCPSADLGLWPQHWHGIPKGSASRVVAPIRPGAGPSRPARRSPRGLPAGGPCSRSAITLPIYAHMWGLDRIAQMLNRSVPAVL